MGILQRLFGSPAPERDEPTDLGDGRGDRPPDGIALYSGGGLAVMGESHYRDTIERLTGGSRRDGVHSTAWAQLVAEPNNAADPNAVAVLMAGQRVGYLSRQDARRYHWVLLDYAAAGCRAFCRLDVRAGWDRGGGDRGDYTLTVYVDSPERQAQLLAAGGRKGGKRSA